MSREDFNVNAATPPPNEQLTTLADLLREPISDNSLSGSGAPSDDVRPLNLIDILNPNLGHPKASELAALAELIRREMKDLGFPRLEFLQGKSGLNEPVTKPGDFTGGKPVEKEELKATKPFDTYYDAEGKKTSESHFHDNGKLKEEIYFNPSNGHAYKRNQFNANGQLTAYVNYDPDTGARKFDRVYREDGTTGSIRHYGADGKHPLMEVTRAKDGSLTRTDYEKNGDRAFSVSLTPKGELIWHDRPNSWRLFPPVVDSLFNKALKAQMNGKAWR